MYADGTTNSAAAGDSFDEVVYCVAANALKILARGDKRDLATMLRFDALAESIGAGVVDFVIWRVGLSTKVGSSCLDVRMRSLEPGETGPNILHGGDEDSPQEDIPKEGSERTQRGHVRTCEDTRRPEKT